MISARQEGSKAGKAGIQGGKAEGGKDEGAKAGRLDGQGGKLWSVSVPATVERCPFVLFSRPSRFREDRAQLLRLGPQALRVFGRADAGIPDRVEATFGFVRLFQDG